MTLTEADVARIEMTAPGRREVLIVASLAKHALASTGLSGQDQLQILTLLNQLLDRWLTVEVLTAIEPPADDTALEMYQAAIDLDGNDKTRQASFRVLSSEKVFRAFVELNPSLLRAIHAAAR
jgi:hypothetical protein